MWNEFVGLGWHRVLMLGCLFVMGAIFVLIMGSILRHRQVNKGASFHRSLFVELMWTLIPLVIVLLTVFPAVQQVFARAL